MNPDEAQDNFNNFLAMDNYQNGILILKGMLAMKQELLSHEGDRSWMDETSEDWSWMEKDTFYLVTNGNALFIINKFKIMGDFFYYWNLMNLQWIDNLQIPWLEAQIESVEILCRGESLGFLNVQRWKDYLYWNSNNPERWWTKNAMGMKNSVWTRGPIIPIIPIPSSMMYGFMNWTTNPLED